MGMSIIEWENDKFQKKLIFSFDNKLGDFNTFDIEGEDPNDENFGILFTLKYIKREGVFVYVERYAQNPNFKNPKGDELIHNSVSFFSWKEIWNEYNNYNPS
jgi:hypothetical protein